MSQIINDRATDDLSENTPTANVNCAVTTEDYTGTNGEARSALGENIVDCMLVVSMPVTMEKIWRRAESAPAEEVISMLHEDNLKLTVFKTFIKSSGMVGPSQMK